MKNSFILKIENANETKTVLFVNTYLTLTYTKDPSFNFIAMQNQELRTTGRSNSQGLGENDTIQSGTNHVSANEMVWSFTENE